MNAAGPWLTQDVVAHDVNACVGWLMGQLENWNLCLGSVTILPEDLGRMLQLHQDAVDQLRNSVGAKRTSR